MVLFVCRVVLCCHIRLCRFVVMGVGHGNGLALQPLLEFRIALSDGDMADGIPQGAFLPNDNADFLGTGHGLESPYNHKMVSEWQIVRIIIIVFIITCKIIKINFRLLNITVQLSL
jgi:hypothetical protein